MCSSTWCMGRFHGKVPQENRQQSSWISGWQLHQALFARGYQPNLKCFWTMLAPYNSNKNQTTNIFGAYFLASVNQIMVMLLILNMTCCRFLKNLTRNLLRVPRPQRGEIRSLYLRRQGGKTIPLVTELRCQSMMWLIFLKTPSRLRPRNRDSYVSRAL